MIPLEDERKVFTLEENNRYKNQLVNDNKAAKSSIRSNVIIGLVAGVLTFLAGQLLKVTVSPSMGVIHLINYVAVAAPFMIQGTFIYQATDRIKHNNAEIARISEIIKGQEMSASRGEVKEDSHVISEREYQEILAEENGYKRGENPAVDQIFDKMLDQQEKERQERTGHKVRPVGDDISDVIPAYDDDFVPEEINSGPKRR